MTQFKFQGTDGVRQRVAFAKEYPGLFPQQAFIKKGVITEDFMELYCYCAIRWMIDCGMMSEDERVVIGWDPRDRSGKFTSYAIAGAIRAGARVQAVGIIPTPGVVVYMRSIKAGGAIMITASHNPSSYNGIKIFTRSGLKLLPGDDIELSDLIMKSEFIDVKRKGMATQATDAHDEAVQAFIDFSIDRRNSWIDESIDFSRITLILDCANGAFAKIAEPICKQVNFGEVICLNNSLDNAINDNCGVACLEGIKTITPDMIEAGGRLDGNSAIKTLFDIGRKNVDAIKSGEKICSAAIFDGDGDRFFRADYDPFTDSCFLLTGDETAILQAEYLKDRSVGKLFVSSVESDLGVSIKAARIGYKTLLTPVGDKWILLQAVLAAIRPKVADELYARMESIATGALPSAMAIEKLLIDEGVELLALEEIDFAIGAEESGHNITPGVIDRDGEISVLLAGNGMKSCLNTFAATSFGSSRNIELVEDRLNRIKAPYPLGFKKTLYVFYVDKNLWRKGSPIWKESRRAILGAVAKHLPTASVEELSFAGDSDMLYLKIVDSSAHVGSIFIRNSGTEDKIGITLRGSPCSADELLDIGGAALKILLLKMKDISHTVAKEEIDLLEAVQAKRNDSQNGVTLNEKRYDRLLIELGIKQGILSGGSAGLRLTELGGWYLSNIREKKR